MPSKAPLEITKHADTHHLKPIAVIKVVLFYHGQASRLSRCPCSPRSLVRASPALPTIYPHHPNPRNSSPAAGQCRPTSQVTWCGAEPAPHEGGRSNRRRAEEPKWAHLAGQTCWGHIQKPSSPQKNEISMGLAIPTTSMRLYAFGFQ